MELNTINGIREGKKKYDQIKNFYEINDSWWLFFNLRLLKTRLIL